VAGVHGPAESCTSRRPAPSARPTGLLAGTIGLLLWTFATSVALLLGLALAAQLEAVRAGTPDPRMHRDQNL
jgi:uncharacterized BrkB/YihY/UPF0761 family membrane protein